MGDIYIFTYLIIKYAEIWQSLCLGGDYMIYWQEKEHKKV